MGRDKLEKKYYKIKEVASILDLPESTLRYWEKCFSILNPKRGISGARLYTSHDIEQIRMISFLVRDKGLKLDAAEDQLARNRTGMSRKHEAIEKLQSVKSELEKLLDALNAMK